MQLKQSPEDFIVEEIPLKDYSKNIAGNYAIYKLWKKNFNTEDAIHIICKKGNIKRNDIKFAGAKDRNAVTTQYISIARDKGKIVLDEEHIKLIHIGFSDEPISLGNLVGNTFELCVRDISPEEKVRFELRAASLTGTFLLPNYFDEQRFSTSNVAIGLCLLKRDFKGAVTCMKQAVEHEGYYEKQVISHLEVLPQDYIGALKKVPPKILLMYLHAVQSKLFNEMLAERLIKLPEGRSIPIPYSQGVLYFSTHITEYEQVAVESLPLVGFSTHPSKELQQLLTLHHITPRDFIIRAIPELSIEGSVRSTMMQVTHFSANWTDESTLTLNFSLPKGSYATTAIKALFA